MGENKEYITLPDENGMVNISSEVITAIAASAALETEGVAAFSVKKGVGKGIRVTGDENGVIIDVYLLTVLSAAVQKTGMNVQKAVASAVESSTGITVKEVNVHIGGVSLEKKTV